MKFYLTLLVLLVSMPVISQDVLVTKDGDAIKAYDMEVAGESVYYKQSEAQDAPIVKIAKSDLLVIKYKDGRKEVVGETAPAPATQQTAAAPQPSQPQSRTDEGSLRLNDAAVRAWHDIDVQYVGEQSKKEANIAYCQCRLEDDAVIADSQVELLFQTTCSQYNGNPQKPFPQRNTFLAAIKNKTTKTIYLDLGNSFFLRGTESFPLYVPSSTSTTSGTTTGASVNVGAVTGAMGVGGAVGKIANGVNVGGSSSNFGTVTTYAQRIVAVPPMSVYQLGNIELFEKSNPNIYRLKYDVYNSFSLPELLDLYLPTSMMPKEGQTITVTDPSLLRFGVYVTYAEDEGQTQPYILKANFSLAKIIGAKANKFVTDKFLKSEKLTPNLYDAIFFMAYPKEQEEGTTVNAKGSGLVGGMTGGRRGR